MNNKKKITIIDYGVGNILSLKNSLEHLGTDVFITNKKKEILQSSHIILPGVGAFPAAMNLINDLRLKDILHSAVSSNINLLGICLGMQLLLTESEEFTTTKGLNLIPGKVRSIEKFFKKNKRLKLPHIGWNQIIERDEKNERNKLVENISKEDHFYFVHSFISITDNINHHLFFAKYEDIMIPAVIGFKNIYGFQFHPEKSGKAGLKLLKNFINL
jgi:imidazole glycerol-phosphate synthase subunit HisH